MTTNYRIERDLFHALTMSQVFEDYVRSDQLYGYAAGLFSNMPSMTIGSLVMRLRRIDTLRMHMPDSKKKKLDDALDKYLQVRTDWLYHFENKIKQEAHSRVDAMKGFFYECSDNIRNCIGIYKPEMMRRTIVQELVREMEILNIRDGELIAKITETDDKLRRVTEKADFQWADILIPAYDEKEFWWLYNSPPNLP
ncbi:MAG: hypothetical protein AAFR81_01785 [Chloroflexota bacterium]